MKTDETTTKNQTQQSPEVGCCDLLAPSVHEMLVKYPTSESGWIDTTESEDAVLFLSDGKTATITRAKVKALARMMGLIS